MVCSSMAKTPPGTESDGGVEPRGMHGGGNADLGNTAHAGRIGGGSVAGSMDAGGMGEGHQAVEGMAKCPQSTLASRGGQSGVEGGAGCDWMRDVGADAVGGERTAGSALRWRGGGGVGADKGQEDDGGGICGGTCGIRVHD